MQNIFRELNALYGDSRLRRMALICHYTWCVTALSYYVTGKFPDWLEFQISNCNFQIGFQLQFQLDSMAKQFSDWFFFSKALNADNLAANRVVYVAATGAVDFSSLILSMTLLNFFGRKISSCGLFALSGFFLLSLIVIPRGVIDLLCFIVDWSMLLLSAYLISTRYLI